MTKKKKADVIPNKKVLDYLFSLSDDLFASDRLLNEVTTVFTNHEQADESLE